MTTLTDRPAHDVERFPLIVYVHVPKTAGSTVNKVLWLCSHRGQGHCEEIPRPKLLEAARRFDWLSGHLGREGFASSLVWLDRPIEYFAAVREPVSQLLSHLNWTFEIYNRGQEFFLAHPRKSQLISNDVRATDFSNASSVMALLLRYKGIFLNGQATTILGSNFDTISESEAARRVASYTYIATEQDLPALYRAFGFAALPKQVNELRENIAKEYYFDTAIFRSKMLDFLAEHHRHDFRLYDCARQCSPPSEGRRPFRPAFPFVTADNYEEESYLANNPDVAKTLKRHRTWRSGYDHFVMYGHAEQRRQLIMPSSPSGQEPRRYPHLIADDLAPWV
jgi:hypothetical protein